MVSEKQIDRRRFQAKHKNSWFYLDDQKDMRCSFHNDFNHVHDIPVTVLLRALESRGFLDQWDRNAQVLRKIKRVKR